MGSQLADLKGVEVELRETTREVDQLESQLAAQKEAMKTWEAQGAPRLKLRSTNCWRKKPLRQRPVRN